MIQRSDGDSLASVFFHAAFELRLEPISACLLRPYTFDESI